jgi:ABC-type lipoprotein export system ATPase subunit
MTSIDISAVYELRNVSRAYTLGGVEVKAVREVDLSLHAGESVAIVGPSGSGKTTLLQLLGALDRPSGGELLFEGRDIGRLGDRDLSELRLDVLGFVFQQFNPIPTLIAAQNVEIARAPTSISRTDRRDRVLGLLAAVGLDERADHVPSKLSGGEQQRVAIARALANEPHVLLADEPTGNLDSTTGAEIMDLLLSLSGDEHRRTVIVVTHDASVAARALRVIRMLDGRLVPGDRAARGAAGVVGAS